MGDQTRIMAVLNLTPDSFYAASRVARADEVLAVAEAALAAGADILDLGAESTRPGAAPLAAEEELQRLLPPLAAVRRRWPQCWLSADTRHAAVARAALDAGADIINDVSGLGLGGAAGEQAEGRALAAVIAASGCGAVLMHRRGDFATMHHLPPVPDPVGLVAQGLAEIAAQAAAVGIAASHVVLDPGFGFGKNGPENWPLLAQLDRFQALGFPLLAGLSRKSFIGRLLGGAPPEQRLYGTVAAVTAAILRGADIVRVHDVAPARDAARVADAVLAAGYRQVDREDNAAQPPDSGRPRR
ncbi:MAG: dihydropteroate synthase [Terriglobales bacterium]